MVSRGGLGFGTTALKRNFFDNSCVDSVLPLRGAPFSPAGFARMIERAGTLAKFGFKAHPHMLRHACGYKLANDGHDTRALQAYLGHKNIQHTVRYTELAPTRFKDFWRR